MGRIGICKLCYADLTYVVSIEDAKSGEPLTVCYCNACGCVQQVPIPSDHELRIYYSHHYRADYKRTYSPRPKYVYRAGRAARERISFLTDFFHANGLPCVGKTMLDIGAGGGEVVFAAAQSGFIATGIEPNEGYSSFAREQYGIEVRTAHLEDVEGGPYALITMFHVLEHMPHPRAVFRRLHELIEPDGHLFVEVPNIEQSDASPSNIFFKAHLYYFSSGSLIFAASEAFDPVRVDRVGNLRIVFKRKPHLTQAQPPSQQAIEHTQQRLRDKGWREYLTTGGGWRRPFQRIVNRSLEMAYASHTPLVTLRRALKQK